MEPNMNMGAPMQQEEKKPIGTIIGIIVIVLVLAFGAFYFLKQVPTSTENSVVAPATSAQKTTNGDATVSALSAQGSSTDIADIQKDLDASDFTTLDMGLDGISI